MQKDAIILTSITHFPIVLLIVLDVDATTKPTPTLPKNFFSKFYSQKILIKFLLFKIAKNTIKTKYIDVDNVFTPPSCYRS